MLCIKPIILFSICFLLNYPCLAQVSLSANPKVITRSGDSATIQWTGVDSPSELDWLGIYSPPNSTHDNFFGYIFLSTSPGWGSGSGSISIPIVKMRSEYQFRIFHWNVSEIDPTRMDNDNNPIPGTKNLLAVSEDIGFESGHGPEHVHLALTGRGREMRVMFLTDDGKDSFVKYGLKPKNMDHVVGTRVGRYEREDMCDAPANSSIGWRDPGYIHDGIMINLKQGKRYYYQVGSNSTGWSEIFSFVSPDDDSDETIAFLFGDMGTDAHYTTFDRTQKESSSTIKWISRDIEAIGDKPAMISHIGDISYARGYSWLWDNFFTQVQPIASKLPYHVCIGNHEYDWPSQPWKPDWAITSYKKDGGGECGVPYSLRFNMPGNSEEPTGTHAPATRNLYYSFNMGVVHFVYLSTETNFLTGSKQHDFLKNDLESVNRKKTPFIVVQGHRPMYTTSSGHKDGPLMDRLREHLEPLFIKNKVSLVLWGHVHTYERFCPINNYTCGSLHMNGHDWKAFPVHVVIGMAGQDSQPPWKPRPEHPDDHVYPQPAQSLYRGFEFGYTRIVATKKKLKFSYVGNHDGQVHDEVEIMAPKQALERVGNRKTHHFWRFRNGNLGVI